MKELWTYLRAAGDLLMPRVCVVCGCTLGVHERHLCLACAADVPYTRYWRQAHNPLADRFNALLERHRGTEPMDYAYAVSLMYYKGAYRSIPRALKYHDNLSIGRFYGSLLGRHLAAAPHFADIDLVIPVPLHWTRRRSRGYNQAAILARALTAAFRTATDSACTATDAVRTSCAAHTLTLSDATRIARNDGPVEPVIPGLTGNLPAAPPECRTDLLVRVRRTRTQTRVSVDQKARNVASAFRVPERFSLWRRFAAQLIRFASRVIRFVSRSTRFAPRSTRFAPRLIRFVFRLIRIAIRSNRSASRSIRLARPHGSGRFLSLAKGAPESPASVLASARHILLVDDTFTTGSTLYACYAALRPFTNARISIATLAAVEGTSSAVEGMPSAVEGTSSAVAEGP